MSRKLNERFVECYINLDRLCCEKFGFASGGVTEYINRLNKARFAPDREDALPRLVRYRNLRNKLVHESGAMRRSSEVSKSDIKWLQKFTKDIQKRKDPISSYLRKARWYVRKRKIKRGILIGAFSALAIVAVILIIALS